MTQETLQLVSGILAVLCGVAIIIRRKTKKKSAPDDEF
jgi:hypothetical protein